MPIIFDCFTFNDELDILETRLACHDPYVAQFVLVESTRTFSGASKELTYAKHAHRFARWSDKIRHIVVDDLPDPDPDRWKPEVYQRNQILRGLTEASPDDVVLVADVDELVHPEVLDQLSRGLEGVVGLAMPSTFSRANWHSPLGIFAAAARAYPRRLLTDPHNQRNHASPDTIIHDGGRHFTYLLSPAETRAKFERYAHREFDNDRDKSEVHLRRCQGLGVDVAGGLVTAIPRAGLCHLERELMVRRPDLFDFSPLPPLHRRLKFRWYTVWRKSQPGDSRDVARIDAAYETKPAATALRAAIGAGLAGYARARRVAAVGKRRFAA